MTSVCIKLTKQKFNQHWALREVECLRTWRNRDCHGIMRPIREMEANESMQSCRVRREMFPVLLLQGQGKSKSVGSWLSPLDTQLFFWLFCLFWCSQFTTRITMLSLISIRTVTRTHTHVKDFAVQSLVSYTWFHLVGMSSVSFSWYEFSIRGEGSSPLLLTLLMFTVLWSHEQAKLY